MQKDQKENVRFKPLNLVCSVAVVPLLPPLGVGTVVVPAGTAAEIHFFSPSLSSLASPALNTPSTCRNRRHVKRHGRGQSSQTSSRTKWGVRTTAERTALVTTKARSRTPPNTHFSKSEYYIEETTPDYENPSREGSFLSPSGEYKRTQNRRFGHDSCSGGGAS